jgi:hypothetical protein
MKLIGARQAWTDSQHESNASITAVASEKAESASKIRRSRITRHEVVFPALGEDKEERVLMARQRISISETRRTPLGRSTARAAHLVTMGKIQRAIGTLPFQVEQLGHFLYHPCMTMQHVMNAEKLILADTDFSAMTAAKAAKARCLVTIALQSYKATITGASEWGPARVAESMKAFYGAAIEPKRWDRDWLAVWETLKAAIHARDIEAQSPIWQVIHSEKDESAA